MKQIFAILRVRTGHDFSCYKQSTIHRRLQRRMSVCSIYDVSDYAGFLKDNEAEIKALLKDILIRVTGFFRDPEAFDALKENLKVMLRNKSQGGDLRVWVAGCATGEEAYSIAMLIVELMDELEKSSAVQIYATDIDADALNIARAGVYPPNIAADVTPERLRRFFVKDSKSYHIKKQLREMVVFAPQDFIKDPPFSKMDLICCRNLLIYLNSNVQKKLVPLLHYALKPGGLLFLGTSESVGEATDLFSILDKKWKIFQRREAVVSLDRLRPPVAFAPSLREPAFDPSASLTESNLPDFSEKIFLDNFSPTFAVINEKFRPVYVRGRTGKYLELATGKPSWSILEMAREGLRTELASALYRATAEKKPVVREGIRVRHNGGFQTINITVAPLGEHGMPPGLMMVVFQEVGLPTEEALTKPAARSRKQTARLEEELRLTKENLQSRIEELEATNEELVSANEELQSTNEELDTSREELQSLNEELLTVNSELSTKTEMITKANDDLKNYLSRTDIAIIFLDNDLKIRSYTPATADVFNVREIDIGRPLIEIASRLAYEGIGDNAKEVLRTLQPKEIEVQRKDGHWYTMRILPYFTIQNAIGGLVLSFLDIDKQKQAEAVLAHLASFPELNPDFVMELDTDGVVTYLNPTAKTKFPDISSLGKNHPFLPGWETLVNQLCNEKRGPLTREVNIGDSWYLQTVSYEPMSNRYRLYGKNINEGKKAEEALKASEEKYRTIITTANEGVWVVDNQRQTTYVNERMAAMLGYSVEEMMTKSWIDLTDQESRAQSDINIEKRKQGIKDSYEYKLIHKDGAPRWFLINATPYFDKEGKFSGTVSMLTDITERKKAEEALIESEERFFKAFRASPIPMTISRVREGLWVDVNDSYCRLVEYSREELVGHLSTELNIIDQAERERLAAEVVEKGAINGGEVTLRTRSGKRPVVLYYVEKILLQGVEHSIITAVDITERKRGDKALKESEANLSEAQRIAHIGSYEWNIQTGEVHWSDAMYQVFGVDRKAFIPTITGFTDFIHPDDLKPVSQVMNQMVSSGKPGSVDFRIILSDGSVRYIHSEGKITAFDEQGKPSFMVGIDQDITERKKAEQAIVHEKDRARKLLDIAGVMILGLDTEGKVTLMNAKGCEILGYKVEEILGKKWVDTFLPERIRSNLQGDFQTLSSGNVAPVEYIENPVLTKSGEERLIAWYNSVIRNEKGQIVGTLSSGEDITERKQAEEALVQTKELAEADKARFETLLITSPSAIVVIENPDGRISFINERARELYGMDPRGLKMEEYPQIGLLKLDGTPYAPEDMPASRSLLKGEVVYGEDLILARPDGSRIIVSASSAPLKNSKGEITSVIGIFEDITERKQAEEALKRYTAELEAANKELESYSYSISHDLRTPLRTLEGFSEMVITEYGDKLDETGKNYLNRIRKAGQTMSQLTEDILKLSRITRAEMHKGRVNLSEMTASIANELKALEPGRQAEFIIAPDIFVNGDKALLEISLRNLLENSWKYSGKCPDTRIEVGTNRQDGKMVYFIKDNGVGFDMKYYDKLFQPFQRLHTSKDYPGTGIGLATVARVIHRHSGKIWAESEIGKGTTFYFTLGD